MFKTIDGGKLPERATRYSAGFDVFANEDVVIGAGETVTIGLGIALDVSVPMGDCNEKTAKRKIDEFMNIHHFELHPRSSLRAKGLGGGVGIIDIDYLDEIKMVITNPLTSIYCEYEREYNDVNTYKYGIKNNDGMQSYTHEIKKGDKIGQLILKRHEGWLLPAEYTKDEERVGGFGSTGGIV